MFYRRPSLAVFVSCKKRVSHKLYYGLFDASLPLLATSVAERRSRRSGFFAEPTRLWIIATGIVAIACSQLSLTPTHGFILAALSLSFFEPTLLLCGRNVYCRIDYLYTIPHWLLLSDSARTVVFTIWEGANPSLISLPFLFTSSFSSHSPGPRLLLFPFIFPSLLLLLLEVGPLNAARESEGVL